MFNWEGDYMIDEDGDLADTSSDQIVSCIQEIQTIANSDFLDWRDFDKYAAGLNDFVGEPNNRKSAEKITQRLKTALLSNNIVKADDLSIKVVPVSRHQVLIIVSVNALSTNLNTLDKNAPAKVILVYDYIEQGIFFLEGNQFISESSDS